MVVDAKAGSPMSSYLQNLKAVETPDKQTVVLRFTGANLPMMPLMHSPARRTSSSASTSRSIRGCAP